MLARFAFVFAVLGIALIILLTVIGGAAFPDYSHATQFISELGARDAPHEALAGFAGFLPAGLLLVLFTAGAFEVLPRSKRTTFELVGLAIYALGYVAAAIFPCDPGCRPVEPSVSQLLHNLFGLIGYVLAPAFMFELGRSARCWPGGEHLALPAFIVAAITLLGVVALFADVRLVGLAQRAIEASILTWLMMCAFYVRARISKVT